MKVQRLRGSVFSIPLKSWDFKQYIDCMASIAEVLMLNQRIFGLMPLGVDFRIDDARRSCWRERYGANLNPSLATLYLFQPLTCLEAPNHHQKPPKYMNRSLTALKKLRRRDNQRNGRQMRLNCKSWSRKSPQPGMVKLHCSFNQIADCISGMMLLMHVFLATVSNSLPPMLVFSLMIWLQLLGRMQSWRFLKSTSTRIVPHT